MRLVRKLALFISVVAVAMPLTTASASAAEEAPSSPAAILQARIDHQIQSYGGVQISPNEVSYEHGSVIMVFMTPGTSHFPTAANRRQGSPNATEYHHGCPEGRFVKWWCFYDWDDFNAGHPKARMLQFSDCTQQGFGDYGFRNSTSSWVNTSRYRITVWNFAGSRPDQKLWTEERSSESRDARVKDKADYFTCANP